MNYGSLFSSKSKEPPSLGSSKPKPRWTSEEGSKAKQTYEDRSKDKPAMKNFGTSNVYAWIDLETTDLDHSKGEILEIALILTSANDLREIKRQHIIVHHGEEVFSKMSDWCQTQHRMPRADAGNLSLVDLCRTSTVTLKKAESLLGEMLDYYRQDKWILMCGSSLRLDYLFLTHHMPSMKQRFHYRQGDVSSLMEFCKRFYPGMTLPSVPKDTTHCAMHDIEASLNLLRWFRKYCMIFPPTLMATGVAKTYYWGFDEVGGPAAPSCLDYLDTTKREWRERGHGPSKTEKEGEKDARIVELEEEVKRLNGRLKELEKINEQTKD